MWEWGCEIIGIGVDIGLVRVGRWENVGDLVG